MANLLIDKENVRLIFSADELKYLQKEIRAAVKNKENVVFSFPRTGEQVIKEKG